MPIHACEAAPALARTRIPVVSRCPALHDEDIRPLSHRAHRIGRPPSSTVLPLLPMPTFSNRHRAALRSLPDALPTFAWLLALGLCAWVAAELSWQFAAPEPVAALARHEPDARKAATRIGLHVGHAVPAADNAPARATTPDARYTVTGIATGFGALPGFVILQAGDGSTLSLSPGQALPDGRRLVRLLPEAAEFELDGRRSALALPARGGEPGDALRPPTPVADGGPRRDPR